MFHGRNLHSGAASLRAVCWALLLLLAVWLGLFWQALRHPPVHQDWIARSIAKKEAGAAALAGPRLVLLAGSAAMFGIRTPVLAAHFQRPGINLGVNAGLLLPYVLDRGLAVVRKGDLVLAPLEYHMYTWDGELNSVLMRHVVESDPAWLRQRPWLGAKLLFQVPAAQLIRQRWLPSAPAEPGLYGPHHLDGWGDQTHSSLAERSAGARDWLYRHSPPHDYGKGLWRQSRAWHELQGFADKLAARGACLILLPSPLAFEPVYRTDAQERAFYRDLPAVARSYGLTYLGQPADFMYDKSLFFDTEYHLSAEGRALHTSRLLALLTRHSQAGCLR